MPHDHLPRVQSAPAWPARLGPDPPYGFREESPDSNDLQRIGAVLRRRRGTIAAGMVTVLALVVVATHFWPRVYESQATILVAPQAPPLEMLERLGSGNQVETEIELIKSRRVIEAAVDELDLHVSVPTAAGAKRPADVFATFEAGRDAVPGRYRVTVAGDRCRIASVETGQVLGEAARGEKCQGAGLAFTVPAAGLPGDVEVDVVPFAAAVAGVGDRIDVSRVQREADLLRLTCKAGSADAAHALCKSISESYLRLRTELQRTEATATVVFLKGQVANLGEQLRKAEDELEAYTRDHNIVGLDEKATEEVKHVADLRAQREQLDVERQALTQFIGTIESRTGDPSKYRDLASFPTLLQNQAFTAMLVDLVHLEGERSDLAVRRTERDPELAALDRRIDDIYGQLRVTATSHQAALAAQIKSLDSALQETGQRMRVIPAQQVQTARLKRQASLLDDLYRQLETRLHEAQVAEAINLPNVDIVDAASFALRPSSPRPLFNLAMGLVLGLVYGGLLAGFQESRDRRIREPDQVERRTGLPVLSLVPQLRHPGAVLKMALPAELAEASEGEGRRRGEPQAASRPRGPMLLDPREGIALRPHTNGWKRANGTRASVVRQKEQLLALESFHSLAADLRIAAERLGRESRRSVAVTSASRGEGKTFTACNLALVCAAHGARTLLIDADMRGGAVSRFFDLASTSPGLSDALAGNSNFREEWNGLRVNPSELWILPAGTLTPHSAGLLASPRFRLLLARAEAEFDRIIIDTPPLSVITDAATIAAGVDSILLVVRDGVTESDALDRTLERLGRANSNTLGVVLNGARQRDQSASLYEYSAEGDPDAT
jgi:polysaccharide biosynthesis transport protein